MRSRLTVGISLVASLAVSLLSISSQSAFGQTGAAAGLRAPSVNHAQMRSLQGLADGAGLWVNMWHYPEVAELDAYCLKLHSQGIRNLFVQTSRSNTPAIANPDKLGPLIEACHKYKIRVIGWAFHELANTAADADKIVAAAQFRSASGDKLDGMAPNLEKNLAKPHVESYLKRIRAALGSDYPLIAVVYSPLNKAPAVAQTPWKTLAEYCDVIAPMAYWNSKYQQFSPYDYTLATVRMIRQLTGRWDVEVHVIGDGMGTRPEAIKNFLRGCRAAEATSASLYPNHKPTGEQLETLSHYFEYFPVNSRFRLAALRELMANGVLDLPAVNDPAASVSRGAFYALLLRQMDHHKLIATRARRPDQRTALDITPIGAYKILSRVKAVGLRPVEDASEESLLEYLSRPVWPREALELVARLVEAKNELKRLPLHAVEHQARAFKGAPGKGRENEVVSWFVQPAFAESWPAREGDRPLSYLDAAQIV
ncbi:MAG TPA: hypothetical protein V6D17_12605, partial [Candidatus Obscuribacterales bacterium]